MKCTLLLISWMFFVAGCGIEPGEKLGPDSAIGAGWIVISADADRAYLDRTITISTRCRPMIKGKGRIGIRGWGEWPEGGTWMLKWPVRDTITGKSSMHFPVEIPASFESGTDFVQQWKVRLYEQRLSGRSYAFYFEAHARMDSVFVTDSNRYFPIESIEARRGSWNNWGYDPGAGSTILNLERP